MVSEEHRVVVTGLGVISPLGLDVPGMWKSLIAGESGVDYIKSFDTSAFDTKFAAEVKDFDPTAYVDRKQARHSRAAIHAVTSSRTCSRSGSLNTSW